LPSRIGFAAVALLVSFTGLSVVTPVGGVAITAWLVGCGLIALSIALCCRVLFLGGPPPPVLPSVDDGSGPLRETRAGVQPACMPALALSPLVFLFGMLVIQSSRLLH
jgi:hypothetical protein